MPAEYQQLLTCAAAHAAAQPAISHLAIACLSVQCRVSRCRRGEAQHAGEEGRACPGGPAGGRFPRSPGIVLSDGPATWVAASSRCGAGLRRTGGPGLVKRKCPVTLREDLTTSAAALQPQGVGMCPRTWFRGLLALHIPTAAIHHGMAMIALTQGFAGLGRPRGEWNAKISDRSRRT